MHMLFGFGDAIKHRVTNFSFSLGTVSGDTKLANVIPGEVSVSLELPPTANPAEGFLAFAVDQHNTASEKGEGTIVVYKGQDVGESLQEISFSNAWITDIDIGSSEMDEKFNVSLRIAAADIVVSGVTFTHRGRGEHF